MEILYKTTKRKQYQYRCDHCEEGYLRFEGRLNETDFLHECENCGTEKMLTKKYPYFEEESI